MEGGTVGGCAEGAENRWRAEEFLRGGAFSGKDKVREAKDSRCGSDIFMYALIPLLIH